MKMIIEWFNPNENNPPFGKQFLALLCGQGSADAGVKWEKYVRFCNVVMKKESPNENEPGDEYREFKKDERGASCFDDYQFCLIKYHDYEFGDERDELDWYSDAIVLWAPMPDLSNFLPYDRP